jgi:hypothetical protein
MNRIDNSGQGLAKLGRDEDKYMAHVAPNEMVVPPVISPETRALIEAEMKAVGLDPNEYTVGEGMSINPITGMPEFGWLKKTFKSIKKVAKKVAPIATLIPGVGTALGGVLGGLGGKVLGGLSKIPGIGGTIGKVGGLIGKGASGIAGLNIPGISSIAGGAAGGFDSLKGIMSLKGMLGGGPLEGLLGMGGQPVAEGEVMYTDGVTTYTAEEVAAMSPQQQASLMEISPTASTAGGSFFGMKTPDAIKGIEDAAKGIFTGGKDSKGIFGGNMGAAGIAALLGKTVYDAAKERQGGLAATPAVTMDALGRYSLANALGTGGTREEFGLGPKPSSLKFNMGGPVNRQYFNQGGAAIKELDMRDGGESAGPGTGTSDDIPAMLSDGEFVMTAKATRGAGAFGMNKTKSGIELIQGGDPSREKGVENMRELMNIFEAI